MRLHEKIKTGKRRRWDLVAAWIWCAFTALLLLGAISAAATGEFEGATEAVIANVFFGLIFAVALILLMFVRNRHRRS